MDAKDNLFGINMLLKIHRDIKRKSDVLIALAHCAIYEDGGFDCFGKNPTDVGSELLPDGWNDYTCRYELQYEKRIETPYENWHTSSYGTDYGNLAVKAKYVLLGRVMDDMLFLNFLKDEGGKVQNVVLDIEKLVKQTNGTLEEMIPNALDVKERFTTELIKPLCSKIEKRPLFGLDMLLKLAEVGIKRKSDVVICLAHFTLVKYGKFQCIGVGENKNLSEDDAGSELLPNRWNFDFNKYVLRYVNEKTQYILMGQAWNNLLIVDFFNMETKQMSSISLDMDTCVIQTNGTFIKMMPSAVDEIETLLKELIEPVKSAKRDVYGPC